MIRAGDLASVLPAPEPPDDRGLITEDVAFLDFVNANERGLVRYDPFFVNIAWLIVLLRFAYPAAMIAVAVGRREDRSRLGGSLKTIGPGETVIADDVAGPAAPLVVATFLGLGYVGVDLHRRDIVVVADATDALSRHARLSLGGTPRARLYGLLDLSREPRRLFVRYCAGSAGPRPDPGTGRLNRPGMAPRIGGDPAGRPVACRPGSASVVTDRDSN